MKKVSLIDSYLAKLQKSESAGMGFAIDSFPQTGGSQIRNKRKIFKMREKDDTLEVEEEDEN